MSGRLLSLILFSLLVSAFALHQLFHHLHNNFDGKFISTNYQSIDRLLDSFLVMSLNFFSNAFTPFAHSRDSRDRIEPFGGVLGVTDGGVDVYSCDYKTAPSGTEYDNYVGGVYTGYKFQCVELARRYLLINHGVVFDSVFMAYQIFKLKGVKRVKDGRLFKMLAVRNGSGPDLPVKGSLIIWEPKGFFTRTGHVAVVTRVSKSSVDIVEQNVDDVKWERGRDYSRRLPVTYDSENRASIGCTYSDTQLLGWMNVDYTQSCAPDDKECLIA